MLHSEMKSLKISFLTPWRKDDFQS